MRRSHGGRRASRATSNRDGSGPPSTSSRDPRSPSHEDRVALADVEDVDPDGAVGAMGGDQDESGQ